MFKEKKKKWIASILVATMVSGLLPMGVSYADDIHLKPKLLISEIVPDSSNTNITGTALDAFEFLEIYNHSDEVIQLHDYELRYRYGTNDILWNLDRELYPSVSIPVNSAIVIWVLNEAIFNEISLADFNANYGTSFIEGEDLFRLSTTGGMHNSAARTLAIVDPQQLDDGGNKLVITQSSYQNDDQTKADKGIFYRMPNRGQVEAVMMDAPGTLEATPGVVAAEQLISLDEEAPEETSPPEATEKPNPTTSPETTEPPIVDTPLSLQMLSAKTIIPSTHSLKVTALAHSAKKELSAKLFYRLDGSESYSELTMEVTDGTLQATVPSEQYADHTTLSYYIVATDERGATVTSDTYNVTIVNMNGEAIDAPKLMVTELLPNSNNINGGDAYEFIEVYNNSDQDINFKDYKLFYIYTDSGREADVMWPSNVEDIVIPAMGTMVFWIINSYNNSLTVEDFNMEFNTSFIENESIVKLFSDGMANSSRRGVAVATNTYQDISVALYDGTKSNIVNKGSHYQYIQGSTSLNEYEVGTVLASPGYVAPEQVPAIPVRSPRDQELPVYSNRTELNQISERENMELRAYFTDDVAVKSVKLFYKTDKDTEYSMRYLHDASNTKSFSYTINSSELIGRNTLSYYYEYSDGPNTLLTDLHHIAILNERNDAAIRTNMEEGQILTGTELIKVAGEALSPSDIQLSIDETVISLEETFTSVESTAYFVFEATDVDYYFKNAVTIGDEIIHTFLDPMKSYHTITVPIDTERLVLGSNKIAVRAATKSGPFDERPEENKDDFKIRNVRLILADGTNLYDAQFNDKNAEIKMGDSAGKYEAIEFDFQLNEQHLNALSYAWDTTKVADGPHTISVGAGDLSLTQSIIVDNTAPSIELSITDDQQLRGAFTLDANVEDQYAGVKQIIAKLNEQQITLPYETSTGVLSSGKYQFTVTAVDQGGNHSERNVSFTIENDNPHLLEVVKPLNGSINQSRNPQLTVNIQDPQNDKLNVQFKRGFHYDGQRPEGFTSYSGASDVEPPKHKVPADEHALTREEIKQLATLDREYYVTDATEQFPYQRFSIQLDVAVTASDYVQVDWHGRSLEGRKVSLYAWNPVIEQWDLIQYKIAGTEDFTLAGSLLAGDYNDNGYIHVMVQDEVPVSEEEYDFTFVWMSDTQYYSESFPDIYLKNTEWIVNNREAMDIRYVIHTGDVVDEADKPYQWETANQAMSMLEEAQLPYGVLAGNHDVDHQTGDYTYFWKHYGEDRFKDNGVFAGSYQNNRGHYDLVSAGGVDFIIVYMGWNIGDAEIDWVNEVVQAHPDRKAILAFHEYLLVSNNRAPIGDEIFERVVVPNKNVFATVSGHYHDAETLIDELDDDGDGVADRKVYQMLADYQGAEMGGLGYIRLMHFNLEKNKIFMKTYSPYLDDYNYYNPELYPSKDEFEIDTDLGIMNKQVATDYIEVNVYTEQLIGKASNVDSGVKASVNWNGLKANTRYEWYVEATDDYSGKARSQIWNFTTVPVSNGSEPSTPTPNPSEAPSATPTPVAPAKVETLELKLTDIALESNSVKLTASSYATNVELVLTAELVKALLDGNKTLELTLGEASIILDPSQWTEHGLSEGEVTVQINKSKIKVPSQYIMSNAPIEVQVQHKSGEGIIRQLDIKTSIHVEIGDLDPQLAAIYALVDGQSMYVESDVTKDGLVAELASGTIYMVAQYAHPFNDITGHWAQRSIEIIAAKQIVNGKSQQSYAPNDVVTRAEFTTMLIRALGYRTPTGQSDFADVGDNAYYTAFIAVAEELELVEGNGNNFRPTAQITREEAIVMLMRAYHAVNKEQTLDISLAINFTDAQSISEWAKQAILEASALSFVKGDTKGAFNPKKVLTRAELAVIIAQFVR